MGSRIGLEQAQQAYAQQRLLAQQQRDLFDAQVEKTKMDLQIDEVMRAHSARDQFSRLLAQGATPEQALMMAGPAMGESMAGIIGAMSRQRHQNLTDQYAGLRLDLAMRNASRNADLAAQRLQQSRDAQASRDKNAAATLAVRQAAEKRAARAERRLEVKQIDKDPHVVALQMQIDESAAVIDALKNKKDPRLHIWEKYGIGGSERIDKLIKDEEAKAKSLKQQKEDLIKVKSQALGEPDTAAQPAAGEPFDPTLSSDAPPLGQEAPATEPADATAPATAQTSNAPRRLTWVPGQGLVENTEAA